MPESDVLLKNRFAELAHRSFSQECYVYSEFLTMAEQDTLIRMTFDKNSAACALKGGYHTAERKIACFGDETVCGYAEEPPLVCLQIAPVALKFADQLNHRDFLGSLLALGIRRSVLGDIVLCEESAYLFCLGSVAGYIREQLTKVKHTAVQCIATAAPAVETVLPDAVQVIVASERLDAIVAAVYKLSRRESQELLTRGQVFVNSRSTDNYGFSPASGSIISVRGFGRFIYAGVERETKKGRLHVSVRIF